jgi:hypothetical protein
MTKGNRDFLPFHDLKEVKVFSPAVHAIFSWHWERILKPAGFLSIPHSEKLIDNMKFEHFWRGFIEEICAANCSTTNISTATNIPVKVLDDLHWGTNSHNTKISTSDVKKLLLLHAKIRPDLQPTKQELS